jgi:hypothetical protein
MKKTIFLTLVLILLLTACGSNSEPATETGADAELNPGAQELPLATKLAVGTLKLENTDLAVAPDQAADLLPLWQVLNDLSSSDTAAPEEITALTEQIQETMTSEQLKALDDMGLTGQDIFATMQELGLVNAPQAGADGSSQSGGGFRGGQEFGGGGFPGGGPPDGGPGGGFGGDNLNPEQIATAQARRAENGGGAGFGSRMLTPLVEAVIELLESKTGS